MTTSNDRGRNPSKPGSPPHVGTGALRASVRSLVKGNSAYVGVFHGAAAAKYARRLELGFVGRDGAGRLHHQAPRPYLRPALLNNKIKILRTFA
jgi:hypothetical protein